MITVATKDIGEVKDCFRDINFKPSLEDGNELYIKKEMGINGRRR